MRQPLIGTYLFSLQLLNLSLRLQQALFCGIWLGLLDRTALLKLDQHYYHQQASYRDPEYNRSGLRSWEREMLTRYFTGCQRLLVGAAGGGRELLALHQAGYLADGFECNLELLAVAQSLLSAAGSQARIIPAAPDTCPAGPADYDGILMGWGGYMLIQGRQRRVAFLRQCRARLPGGAPILLSFFTRPQSALSLRLLALIANLLRRLLGRETIETGDTLEPNFVHYFTREEIRCELQEGGFELAYFSETGYGHAVGFAYEPAPGSAVQAIPPAPALRST